jgi:hypothetical protein
MKCPRCRRCSSGPHASAAPTTALRLVASYNLSPEFRAFLESTGIQPGPGGALRRAALERQPVQNLDAAADTNLPPAALEAYRRGGMRTAIAVPMLKENTLVGAIAFHRREVRPFSDKQTALLKTFADQAVMAIENVRLFKELEEKNQALTAAHAQVTEALDRQSATSEILRVISRSPTDVQPVFKAIADSAARLCEAFDAIVLRVEGDVLRSSSSTEVGSGFRARRAWVPPSRSRSRSGGAPERRRPALTARYYPEKQEGDTMRRLSPWLVAVILAGCASSPKPVAVRVVDDENLVRGCQVLGTVSDDQLEDLQKKAARIGGNVTLLTPQRKSKGGYFGLQDYMTADVYRCEAAVKK